MAKAETVETTGPEPAPLPPKKNKGGRPPKDQDRIPRVLSFFDKVAEIPKEDWGPRARIKIYRTEPSIDRVSLGKKRYVRDSLQPIDEDAIKRATWGGSGSYRLYLTYKGPNEREGKELDSVEVDILDTEYPPRLEPGEWLDLPENAKWKWAKGLIETPPPVQQTPMSSLVEVMNATNEMRKTALEEIRQTQPAPGTDPMQLGLSIAKEFMSMRTENPMVSILEKMLLNSQAEATAQRERIDRLMEKLAEKNNAPAPPAADPLATIEKIADSIVKFREKASEILPGNGGRSRLGPWMEFFQPTLPALIDMLKPVAVAIAQQGSQPTAAPNGAQIHQGQPPQQAADFAVFLDMLTPRMLHFLRDYEPKAAADEFAMWLHDGWGDTAVRAIDTIVAMGGPPALMNWYRTSKHWAVIVGIEKEFAQFLADVIAWKPEDADPPAPPADASAAPIIDLEAEQPTTVE